MTSQFFVAAYAAQRRTSCASMPHSGALAVLVCRTAAH